MWKLSDLGRRRWIKYGSKVQGSVRCPRETWSWSSNCWNNVEFRVENISRGATTTRATRRLAWSITFHGPHDFSYLQPFERFVQTGRIAKASAGPLKGRLVAIVDVIDQNRVSASRSTGGAATNCSNATACTWWLFVFLIGSANWHINEANLTHWSQAIARQFVAPSRVSENTS